MIVAKDTRKSFLSMAYSFGTLEMQKIYSEAFFLFFKWMNNAHFVIQDKIYERYVRISGYKNVTWKDLK